MYIIYQHQLQVSAIPAVAIFRLDKFLLEKLYSFSDKTILSGEYIICQHQLHVSAIAAVAIFRLDTICTHTRPPTLCKTRSRSPLPTLIICNILYNIYLISLIKIDSNLKMATAAMAGTCS